MYDWKIGALGFLLGDIPGALIGFYGVDKQSSLYNTINNWSLGRPYKADKISRNFSASTGTVKKVKIYDK